MKESQSILCLHQGSELYGSDRSFLAAVQALAEGSKELHVVLPAPGALADELINIPEVKLSFFDKGILRKKELKNPFLFVWRLMLGVFFYLREFSVYQTIYINTAVMFSALVAAAFYSFSSRRIVCHIREIPGRRQLPMFRWLLRLSRVELIYNSKATREAFGLAGQVVYNGVAAPKYLPNVAREVSASDPLRLLLIGRINSWKGQDFLIETLGTLSAAQIQSVTVRIVGSPFEGYEYLIDNLVARIKALGLEKTVEMVPFCADPSIHYRWTDYVIVPSIEPEPFGRVAIEAFSFSKPVIAASHGGLTEIIEDGINGFLFEPRNVDAMASIIVQAAGLSSERYEELGRAAQERFRLYFSIEGYQMALRSFFKT